MHRYARFLTFCAAAALGAQPVLAQGDAAHGAGDHEAAATGAAMPGMAHAAVIDATGKRIGMVMLEQTPSGVLVTADIKGLPQGEHGFHFHEKGLCDPAAKFASAGGHFAPGGHQHGLKVAGGPHEGDMPNQYVGADGVLKAEVINPHVRLGEGPGSIADADGTALVIHADPDDYTSQPAGNAGGRIACAVISAPK
ncbi:superoxide dismutase family protein [Novosphingobium album (ex Liu et al. 2023)]|uniref:Superoxide dismutase [Cu-Zn] n=1 Tax=Novosphingobium album (ex Liu et al. 2023) TaxID=3031130 RepID=A0ABT5WPW3_9SPHN|nr:superoxide dismutase family protein [Novosphingobium album (ex Liu et al. 2023)]MDE8652065.1 superoxide dismutase family protein [Novosphingobium album (ex Liu et al. 2023)]